MDTTRASRSMAGMALMLVLWCTAALAVLVTGMVGAQRTETKLASAARRQVEAVAIGRAAIERVVQQIVGIPTPVDRLHRRLVLLDDKQLMVEVLPLSGLIDLVNAPASLLADLFVYAGNLPESAATRLAIDVEARRRQPGTFGSPRGLEATEELLTLPGFDLDLLNRISGLVTVSGTGVGKVNPLCAPDGVLIVLAKGDATVATRISAARDAGDHAIDTTALVAGHVENSVGSRFRFSVRVPQHDGRAVIVVRDIDVRLPEAGGPPWRTLGFSIRRVASSVPQ